MSSGTRKDRTVADRIAVLDVLRLLAAIWVLGYHWFFSGVYIHTYADIHVPALAAVSRYGFLGVHLFFVISGFVISMSMQGSTVAARLIRLYPAYWICATVTVALLMLWGDGRFSCNAACVAANATMLNGFLNSDFIDPSYWSLSVELEFYLIVALLMLGRLAKHLFEFMLLWTLLSASIFTHVPGLAQLYYLGEAMWAPFFGCGAFLFLIWKHGPRPKYLLALALAWLLAASYIATDVRSMSQVAVPGLTFLPLQGIGLFTGFLVLMLLISLRLIALKPSALTRLCGGASYPLYLLHQVAGVTLLNRFGKILPPAVAVAGVAALVLLAAILVWRFAEIPLHRKLRKLFAPGTPGIVPAVSPVP